MPRTGGGGMAMMKASWIALHAARSARPMIALAAMAGSRTRSSNGSKPAKITAAFEALVKVAPEKPAKATALTDAGRLSHDLRGALHDRVGARERGAVGQLDHRDRIALVELRE